MALQGSEAMQLQVSVTLLSNTPVIGYKIDPTVLVNPTENAPPHSLVFTWCRENNICSVHHDKICNIQCTSCVKLNIPIERSCHCSTECYMKAWQRHKVEHRDASDAVGKDSTGNQEAVRKHRSSGSWTDFSNISVLDESAMVVEEEWKVWVKVASSKTYVPTLEDCGFRLRLQSVAVDSSQCIHLSPVNVVVTDPVIKPPSPRKMIRLQKSLNLNHKAKSSNEVVFSVLSYNILADLYCPCSDTFSYCPTWAVAWEYRRENLLKEIIEYDADILCLQEVQSNHFEDFLKPELTKHGYSVMYKKKSRAVYTASKFTYDGCATCYRSKLFKEIMKYEIEFDKAAASVVDALEPEIREKGSIRLLKDNIALVVVLESLQNGSNSDAFQSRICVANTHIHANPNFPDVKLYQVSKLVNGLEKIAQSHIPLIICGDINSLPGSDPHIFVVRGSVNCTPEKENDPLGIYQYLKLHHSLSLVSAYTSFFLSDGVEEHLKKMNCGTKEPVFTNFTQKFCGTLDYIFYTDESLIVESLLELLDRESIGIGLPSRFWSSDHIALMARFRLKPPSLLGPSPRPLPPNPWPQLAAPEQ